MNGDYLQVDLPATVIKDSLSDAMIVQKEDASDSNPWENAPHNDRLRSETAASSLLRGQEETGWKCHFLTDCLMKYLHIV